jgi:hypothetical protein
MPTYLQSKDGKIIVKGSPLFNDKTLKTFTDLGYKVVDKPGTKKAPTPKADKE